MDESEKRGVGAATRRWWYLLLVVLPLLACAGCFAITFFALAPLGGNLAEFGLIPVTGGADESPLTGPTPAPQLDTLPEEQPGDATMTPGQQYRAELEARMEACYTSFEEFYVLEELAVHDPAMLENDRWREDAGAAVVAFRRDCEPIGTLPNAPSSYAEVDHWLKLASAEVGPAVNKFVAFIDREPSSSLVQAIEHLIRFLEYTHNAEAALSDLEERKDI